ncbi:hypothetical protein [Streptomyces sp. NPDC050534]|uniref:hypothetical protein n=1 Tax=Streptomyces sp. NPDC050534 TaxID=3365625 RepID=UPI0037A42B1D
MMRTAAGRRALQVVLLVGGLFALGFLCGEQAHAAEGTPVLSSAKAAPAEPAVGVRSLVGSAVGAVARLTHAPAAPAVHSTKPTAEPKPVTPARPKPYVPATPAPQPHPHSQPHPKTKPADPADPESAPAAPQLPAPARPVTKSSGRPLTDALTRPGTAGPVLGPLTDQLVRTVCDRVVQPVGDLIGTVTTGLGEVTWQIPPLASLPAVPVPGSPSLPVLPPLPGALPGHTLPAPVVQAPKPGDAGHAAEAAVDERRPSAGASGAVFGPQPATGTTEAVAGATRVPRPASAGRAPAHPHPAPDGDPTDELVSHAAVDNGSSRHGDAHAVTLSHRAPVLLAPGSAARAGAAGTRDRHRDIPVFPG